MKTYQRKDDKWIIDFTFKNRRIRKVLGYSKRKAEEIMIRIKDDILDGSYGLKKQKKEEILFEKFAKEYFEEYSKLNKRAWRRDQSSLKHLIPFFKGKTLSGIPPDLIEKYKAKRRTQKGRAGQNIMDSTINRELALLKAIFNKAIEWGKIENSPAKRVKLFRIKNTKERILTDEEMKRLIKTSEESSSQHIKMFLTIALNTGMRMSEILTLRWENVFLSRGYILIEDSKSGKSRKVPLNRVVIEAIKNIDRSSEYLFFNERMKKRLGSIRRSFEIACRRADITGLRIHDLRHTAATKMIEAGIDLVTVSKILGHSKIDMTMRYCHPTPENMQRAIDELGKIFEKSRHKVDTPENLVELRKPVIPLNTYN